MSGGITYKRMTKELAANIKWLGANTEMHQHQIAAFLGVNQGRVNEVLNNKRYVPVKASKPEGWPPNEEKDKGGVLGLGLIYIGVIILITALLSYYHKANAEDSSPMRWDLQTSLCGDFAELYSVLVEEAGESSLGGLFEHDHNQSADFIITANPETGTWTLLAKGPDYACVVGSGQDFHLEIPKGTPS